MVDTQLACLFHCHYVEHNKLYCPLNRCADPEYEFNKLTSEEQKAVIVLLEGLKSSVQLKSTTYQGNKTAAIAQQKRNELLGSLLLLLSRLVVSAVKSSS